MAIRPLKKVEIYAWGDRVSEIIEYVANLRDFHVESIEEIGEASAGVSDSLKRKIQEINTYLTIWKNVEEIVRLHDKNIFSRGVFEARKKMSFEDAKALWNTKGSILLEEAKKMLDNIKNIEKDIEEKRVVIKNIKPWSFIDMPLSVLHQLRHLKVFAFKIPERYFDRLWGKIQSIEDQVWVWARKDKKTWYILVVLYDEGKINELFEIWREYIIVLPNVDLEPSEYVELLEKELAELEDRKKKQEDELLRWLRDQSDTYKILVDFLRVEKNKLDIIVENVLKGEKFVYLWGWMDKDTIDKVKYDLEHTYPVRVIVSDPDEIDEPPVKIHNPWWLRPFEIVTKLYGVPHYRFFDPTKFIAPAFFIFFGIALSDAGYGILLMLVSLYLLLKYRNSEETVKNTLLFIFYLGLTSSIVGVATWTWFGENPFVIHGKALGFFKFFDVVNNTNLALGIVLMLGIFMQMYAMLIKAWWSIKHNDWASAVFDVFTWQIFLLSLVILVMPIIGVSVGGTIVLYAKYVAIASAILLILTQGRHIKNPLGRIVFGLISLYGIAGGYGVASFLADTLSYSRLLALNLSTGIVAHVLNIMLTPLFRIVIGIIILVLAHLLNLALGLLGAFVHSSRLIFLEMYGRFFEETGREFKPINLDGKYYKFVKEVDAK